MNKTEMKACAYITKRFDDAANEVYQEMYGEWKRNYFYYLNIKAPEYLVFMYQAQALLPKAYMNDEPDAKPNALFKALKSNNFEKAKDIIRRTQYMTVKEFAEKNNIYYDLARKEIRSIWTIMTGKAKCESIPIILEDKFVNWMNSELTNYSTVANYTHFYNMKNGNLYNSIFEVHNLAVASILIGSKSKSDLNDSLKEFKVSEEWFKEL